MLKWKKQIILSIFIMLKCIWTSTVKDKEHPKDFAEKMHKKRFLDYFKL